MAKQKQKTHRGVAKRFKLSGKGKPRYNKSFGGHLMSGKSGRRKQQIRKIVTLEGKIAKNIREALGTE